MSEERERQKKKFPYRTAKQCKPWYLAVYGILFIIYRSIYHLRVIGRENIPDGPAVICPRHCTLVDPPMMYFGLTRKHFPRTMAKEELLETPVLGWLLYRIGILGVRRGENDMSSIKNGLRCLKEGTQLIIFPEGTRVREGEHVQAQTGAIMFALKTGAPLVPVYLTRARKFHRMTMVFGEPYHPQIAGKKATPEEMRQLADELLEKIYALESRIPK
ncbi:MAG: 1-acyl-sn-glycerol-3-phosphate acyltransferase [Clostridiales bacterium]|nr:1-acyl-sn-glycerol-3-phosphate acyltransferase [Clostridiales bacterium]